MTYNTKQKEIILNAIKSKKNTFTIKDIYNELDSKTGLTTIYRLVDKLVSDGVLRKNIGSNNETYYQYLEKCNKDNHFYLKCVSCGNLIHVDCECIKELTEHISNKHKFKPSQENIMIDGLCKKCSEVSK
ncbi:MAG: transcriptional repressor [Firmicutes bacterium]|nr:transcriptional repressor [Bacillota bacterium]